MTEQKPTAVNKTTIPPPPRRPAATAAALTPKEIFSILRRHVLLITTLTVLGFIAAGGLWFFLLRHFPKYTAQTFIRVLPPVEKDPLTIGAAIVNKDVQYGYRVYIANLIQQQKTLQDLINKDTVRETNWFRQFARYDENDNIINVNQCILKAFRNLKKRFSAYAHRDAEYVILTMTCSDAKESAIIVNEMASMFISSQVSTKQAEVNAKLSELDKRRIRVEQDLTAAEKLLEDVRTRYQIIDLERPYGRSYEHIITLRLNQLELDQNDLELLIKQVEAAIENLKKLAAEPTNVQIERQVEVDPVMVMLAEQLAVLQSQLEGQLARLGDNHKSVLRTKQQIAEIRQERQLRQTEIAKQVSQSNLKNAQDQLVVLKERYKELDRLLQEARAKKEDLDNARILYDQRLAVRDERKEMLDEIKATIESYRIIHDDPETPKVQSVGPAQVPLEVSSPRWEFYFPGGTILGLIIGTAISLALEVLNDLVRFPRDVARFLNIPLLGVIPDADEDEQVRKINLYHVVHQAPYSIISESYRRCRTNIELSGSGGAVRTLLVSSGAAGDGKTSVAANLAAAFIAENKKVLLVDANFRRPRLHTVFPEPASRAAKTPPSEFGLSPLLTGLCSFEDAVRSDVIEGLDLIESGPLPSNPAELLGSFRMEQLIKDRRKDYDYIILDSPPVLLVSDAAILAKIADATVLVFNAATTRRGAAQRTIRELKAVNAAIAGCVLFAVIALKGGYFREQYKSYRKYQKLQLAHST
jgi:capsular exopolysaccharide synthesis family protein